MPSIPERHVRLRRLADRRDGRLAPAHLAAAEAHLATGCEPCARSARFLERTVAAIRAGPPEAPPPAAERAAIRLLRESCLAFDGGEDAVRGEIVFDRYAAFAVALRSAPGETRRLVWRVGSFEIDASLVAGDSGTDLLAQVVPAGDDPSASVAGAAAVRTGRGVRARSRIESDGRFTFRGLAPGVYTIEGVVDSLRFVLPPVHVA